MNGETVTPAFIEEQRTLGWPDIHPEDYCHKCGQRNMLWCAATRDVWLTATERWAGETGREGICCPQCFADMYRAATGNNPVWILAPDAPGVMG